MSKRIGGKRRRQRTYIRQWRKHRKITQEKLAEQVDMSGAQLSRIETGEQGYTQDLIEAIAHVLRTDVHSLLSRDPGEPETIFPLWDQAGPAQRRQIVEIAKTLIKTVS